MAQPRYEPVPLESEKEVHIDLDAPVAATPSVLTPPVVASMHTVGGDNLRPKIDGGVLQLDWGENNHMCLDCYRLEPCCGEPANCCDGLYCLACWTFCGTCSFAKLLATGQGHRECALVNHCGPFVLGFVITMLIGAIGSIFNLFLITIIRCLLRRRANVGEPSYSLTDCLWTCLPIASACSLCQMLRSVERDDWDWLKQLREVGIPLYVDVAPQQVNVSMSWSPVSQTPISAQATHVVTTAPAKASEQSLQQQQFAYVVPAVQPINIHAAPVPGADAPAPVLANGQVPPFTGVVPVYQPTGYNDQPTQYHM